MVEAYLMDNRLKTILFYTKMSVIFEDLHPF